MRKPSLRLLVVIAVVLFGCRFLTPAETPSPTVSPAPITGQDTPVPQPAATTAVPLEATAQPPSGDGQMTPTLPSGQPAQAGLEVDFVTRAGQPLADVPLKAHAPDVYPVNMDWLPIDLDSLGNAGVIAVLTAEQQAFLSQNGFVAIPSGDLQFKDLRRSVSTVHGQPYYLTVDAAYHALHITFNDLLESLESEYFHPILTKLVQSVSVKVDEYAASSSGQSVAEDIGLAQVYLAVALKLLEPDLSFDPAMESQIGPQIAQIMSYKGLENSTLIPGFEDDYGAYRPVGHYAGKPELENYFRAMTWFGRVAFKFNDPQDPNFKPSRAPLLITLALREASVDGQPAYQVWASLYEITDFMVGPSDDPGPVELSELMEQVYGPAPTVLDLADDSKWQIFLERTDDLPAPKINSTFASFSSTQAAERDWRFMGQRFTPDGFIFQNLIFDKVGTVEQPRKFPSGLDVAAAFGSQAAWKTLEEAGEPKYARYTEQMGVVQKMISEQPQAEWLNRFYTAWLYAFRPSVMIKGEAFPPYMRTSAWGYKERLM